MLCLAGYSMAINGKQVKYGNELYLGKSTQMQHCNAEMCYQALNWPFIEMIFFSGGLILETLHVTQYVCTNDSQYIFVSETNSLQSTIGSCNCNLRIKQRCAYITKTWLELK